AHGHRCAERRAAVRPGLEPAVAPGAAARLGQLPALSADAPATPGHDRQPLPALPEHASAGAAAPAAELRHVPQPESRAASAVQRAVPPLAVRSAVIR